MKMTKREMELKERELNLREREVLAAESRVRVAAAAEEREAQKDRGYELRHGPGGYFTVPVPPPANECERLRNEYFRQMESVMNDR